MIEVKDKKLDINELFEAIDNNDNEKAKEIWGKQIEQIAENAKEKTIKDIKEILEVEDDKVLMARGYRILTSQEKNFYNKMIETVKAPNPQQAFTDLMTLDGGMPTTIIEDVYKDLKEEHPLLAVINFRNVQYLTKWLLNDHSTQKAVWGTITAEITQQIESGFKIIDVNQKKLSAFVFIEKGVVDLGPTFLDGYIREILKDALFCGLEYGIIKGTGNNEPIGMIRDVSEGVTVTANVYPLKEKIELNSFSPNDYLPLISAMAVTESGKNRKFTKVVLICNQADYLLKVMPAIMRQNSLGEYVKTVPYPTDFIISNELETGDAVLALPDEYFMGIGGSKDGVIEYDDSYKFLEDVRTYKIRQYSFGKMFDNTTSLYLDISGLIAAYLPVEIKNYSDQTDITVLAFDNNGATGTIMSLLSIDGSEIILPNDLGMTPPAAAEGKENIFKEWNTTAAGDGTTYSAGDRINIEADTVLYAVWEEVDAA